MTDRGTPRTAAVVTVGTELVTGMAVDTNTAEVASALTGAAIDVLETVSVGDDEGLLAATLARLAHDHDIVVVTGGLGPTHDDVTRAAASAALGLPLVRDAGIAADLEGWAARHGEPKAREQVFVQADVLRGAAVIAPTTGTAPGQIVPTPRGTLVLLPGPPREMRPMLASFVSGLSGTAAPPAVLRCVGMTESDAQVRVQDVLGERADVGFTVLAQVGDVRAVLYDRGIGADGLAALAREAASALGDFCYSTDGASLAEVVLRLARERGERLATAESCTGGMVAAELTAVAGASDVFAGGVVAYANEVKTSALGVEPGMLAQFGAVSEEVAKAMAIGAVERLEASRAVAVTGIAGPDGGTPGKPVGTVWFAVAGPEGATVRVREFPGDRHGVRSRSAVFALDLLRRTMLGS